MEQSHKITGSRQQRWVLLQGIRETIELFARSWGRLPRQAWQTWLRVLVLGWLGSCLLMLALVWLARALIGDETALFQQVVALIPFSFHAAIWIETPGNSVFMIPVMIGAAVVAARSGRPLQALSIIAAFGLIDTIILLGWFSWDRARPTLVYDGIAAPGFHSFPSGHIAQTICMYGLFGYLWMRATARWSERLFVAVLLVLLIGAVGLSRLRLGAHWPSDILAGALVGLAWLLTIVVALRRAEAVQARTTTAPEPQRIGDRKRAAP